MKLGLLSSLSLASAIAFLQQPQAIGAELRTGYLLGVAQSAGTTATTNQDQVAQPQAGIFVDPAGQPVARPIPTATVALRLQGLQFTTNVAATLTFDLVTSTIDHGLVLGVGFNQIIPTRTALSDDAIPTVNARLTTVQGNAQYLARVEQPTWGIAFGGGYNVTSNGRLGTTADGGIQAGGAAQPVPGTQLGAFVVSGVAQGANGTAQVQLTRQRWDLTLLGTYVYTANGIFNLAPAALNQQQGAGAGAGAPIIPGTNLGAFVRATTHTVTPGVTYRSRVGGQGNLTATVISAYTLPVAGDPTTVGTGTSAVTLPAALPIPETIITNGVLRYTQDLTMERNIGLEAIGIVGLRVRTDPISQTPLEGAAPSPDTLITTVRAIYGDTLPGELRLAMSAGASQAHLFQAPLGTFIPFNAEFDSVRSTWTPVFAVAVQRLFDPINVTLGVARDIGIGALGASAIVNEAANLALAYQVPVGQRVAQIGIGFNANRVYGAGRGLFAAAPQVAPVCDPTTLPPGQVCPAANAIVVAFNNRGLGANAGLAVPLFNAGDFTMELQGGYNFNWVDPDPDRQQPQRDGTLGRPPFITHTALVTLGANFGRGPLQAANAGNRETDELDAFSQNPRDGSPLTSARLIRAGAPLLDNTRSRRPGEPPPERRDSHQVYEQSRRQQQIEREAKQRTDIVQGSGTIQDDEEAAQRREREEREERQRNRTRTFSPWPLNAEPLPAGGEDEKKINEKKDDKDEDKKDDKKDEKTGSQKSSRTKSRSRRK